MENKQPQMPFEQMHPQNTTPQQENKQEPQRNENGPRPLTKRLHEGLWDCPYCGEKGIGGLTKHCPHCGHPQDQGTRFYMAEVKKYLDEDTAKNYGKGEDWDCPYCGSMNRHDANVCANCGAPKDSAESTYSTRPKEEPQAPVKTPSRRRGKFLWFLLAAIALIVLLTMPRNRGAELSAKAWARSITIDGLTTVQEQGWSVPNGGRVLSETEQLHHYDEVFAGYQDVEVEKSRRVQDGYDYYTEQIDNGDGTFTEKEMAKPHYETEYYTEIEQQPMYAQVPVLMPYYVYEIERWLPRRTADSQGTTEEPYWADFTLEADEQEGGRDALYQVTFTGDKGKTYTATVPESLFNSLKVGSRYKLTVSGSNIREIDGVAVR